jgi:Ankyrin repeats (many copies)
MLIEKHQKISHLRKELCNSHNFRWMAQGATDFVEGCIFSAATAALWVASERRDLLEKKSLKVMCIGSPLDLIDSGAWWTCFAHFLDKPLNWANYCILNAVEEKVQRTGAVPAGLTSMRLTTIFTDEDKFIEEIESADIVFSHILSPMGVGNFFKHKPDGVSKFFSNGGALLSLFPQKWAATLGMAAAEAFGCKAKIIRSRYATTISNSESDVMSFVVATSHSETQNVCEERFDIAIDMSERMEMIGDLCSPSLFGDMSEECEFWGMRTLLKSSVDEKDFFITLPRKLILRERTCRISEVQNDLAYVDTGMLLDRSGLTEYNKNSDYLLARIQWACAVWDSGIGERIEGTLGGLLSRNGYDKSHFGKTVESIAKEAGLSDGRAKALLASMTGGEPYAPTKSERLIFDKLGNGDVNGVLQMASMDIGLANAINERREPLLLEMGKRGMVDGMRSLIDLGAEPGALDGGGRAILTEASRFCSKEVVKVLLEQDVDVDHQDILGWAALHAALTMGKWDVASMLIDYGADTSLENSGGLSAKGFVLGHETQIDSMFKSMNKMMSKLDGMDISKMLSNNGFLSNGKMAPDWLKEKILAN